jgi:hypothetical protein
MNGSYEFRKCKPEDIPQIEQLVKRVIGIDRKSDYWRWKYFDTPSAKSLSFVITCEGEIVGLTGLIPTKFTVNGTETLASNEVDIAVLEEHRKLNVYLQMVSKIKEELLIQKLDFTFGITIKSTSDLGQSLLGSKKVCAIPRYIKILDFIPPVVQRLAFAKYFGIVLTLLNYANKKYFSHKLNLPPKWRIKQTGKFDERFDALWERIKNDYTVQTVKDSAYLNWRYVDAPHLKYQVIFLEDIEKQEILGFIVYSTYVSDMTRRGSIYDIVTPKNGDSSIARYLIREAVTNLYLNKIALLECWMLPNSHIYPEIRKAGFKSREIDGLDLTYKIIEPNSSFVDSLLNDLENWNFSKGDSDID